MLTISLPPVAVRKGGTRRSLRRAAVVALTALAITAPLRPALPQGGISYNRASGTWNDGVGGMWNNSTSAISAGHAWQIQQVMFAVAMDPRYRAQARLRRQAQAALLARGKKRVRDGTVSLTYKAAARPVGVEDLLVYTVGLGPMARDRMRPEVINAIRVYDELISTSKLPRNDLASSTGVLLAICHDIAAGTDLGPGAVQALARRARPAMLRDPLIQGMDDRGRQRAHEVIAVMALGLAEAYGEARQNNDLKSKRRLEELATRAFKAGTGALPGMVKL